MLKFMPSGTTKNDQPQLSLVSQARILTNSMLATLDILYLNHHSLTIGSGHKAIIVRQALGHSLRVHSQSAATLLNVAAACVALPVHHHLPCLEFFL